MHKFNNCFYSVRFVTGELIGVEYLYAQTGKVLQNSSDEQEEEPLQTSDADDEGY